MTEGTGSGSTAAGFEHDTLGGDTLGTGTGTGSGRGQQVAGAAKEQASDVAGTAKEQAAAVAGSAKEQAGEVLAEAKGQAADLLGDLRRQLAEQSEGVRDRIAEFLTEAGAELGDMAGAGGRSGYATQVVRQVGDRASSWGAHLSQHDATDLLDQTRSLARRKPGTFLLGAVAAGVLAGRLTRGAKAQHDEKTTAQAAPGTAQLVPTTVPATVPATPPVAGSYVPPLRDDLAPDRTVGAGYSPVDLDPNPVPRHLPDVSDR